MQICVYVCPETIVPGMVMVELQGAAAAGHLRREQVGNVLG